MHISKGLSRLAPTFLCRSEIMKFWFLQPDYQHHKNRLLNIGMLAGNKNKTIVELDSNQHNSYLVVPPLFERQGSSPPILLCILLFDLQADLVLVLRIPGFLL